jgi:DNA gyrase subunit A
MRLARLTGLEQDKLLEEYKALLETLRELFHIIEDPDRLLEVIRDELRALRENFNDARRTRIERSQSDLDILDLIPAEDVVVTLSHAGYVKRQPLTVYRSQKRGGKGRMATAVKDEDFVERLWIANTHDTLLAFTSLGRVFKLKVHQVPEASPGSKGRPIVNMLQIETGEKVQGVVPVKEFDAEHFVFFATRAGVVKKTALIDFVNVRTSGIRAVELDEGDGLVDVALTDGNQDIMLFGSHGRVVRFAEGEVRAMGRTARGVIGMRLPEGAKLVSLLAVDPKWHQEPRGDESENEVPEVAEAAEGEAASEMAGIEGPQILTATARGFGKRTPLAHFPRKGRGIQGVIGIKCSSRNGALIGAIALDDSHDVMLISDKGTLVRTRAVEIATVSRNTQGVTLIRVDSAETLVAVVAVEAEEAELPLNGDNGPGETQAAAPPVAGASGEDGSGDAGEGAPA